MSSAYQKVMDSRKELVENLIKLMEGGFYNNPKQWNYSLSPHNPESNVYYKGGNRLRLMIASMLGEYEDARWCTMNQLKEKNYLLKKGSKGVLCEKWIFPDETLKRMNPKKREKMTKEEVEEFLQTPAKVSFFYVFNVENVKDYPAIERKEPLRADELTNLADKLIETSECPVYEQNTDRAYFSPLKDEIHIPSRNDFKNSEAFLSVLLHELGHSTGHESRLNRPFSSKSKNDEGYAKEELIAELSTIFSCGDFGIPPSRERLEDNSDYIKGWLTTLDDKTSELFAVVKDADAASDRIKENYSKVYSLSNDCPQMNDKDNVKNKNTSKKKEKSI